MLVDRMIRAARLDTTLYEEVERDLAATTQALWVVIIVSLASGFGGALGAIVAGMPGQALSGLLGGVVAGFIGWILWSLVTYWIGTTIFGGVATVGELLRTIGFAYTPNILGFFGFIPCLGGVIVLIGAVWSLVAGVVAIRQALDFDTGKAIFTVIIGWLVIVAISAVLAILGWGFSAAF